jgi:hypothetical protein
MTPRPLSALAAARGQMNQLIVVKDRRSGTN